MSKDKDTTSKLVNFYRTMYLIRRFEEASGEQYTLGNIRGFLHLYSGQEAVAVGSISCLEKDDYIVSHYRDHGHALARGMDTKRVMAELFGKRTGVSKGKGGSMHLFDSSINFMGGHAIVGGQTPLAVGLAFAQKYREKQNLTICFFGDGATSQGVYHEALNLAALWKLPVLFFLENNGFGMGTKLTRFRAGKEEIWQSAKQYDIEASSVNGMDVLAVHEATQNAINHIKAGNGPYFLEAKTYRFEGHSLADGEKYRDSKEVDEWRKRDPITNFGNHLIKEGHVEKSDIDSLEKEVEAEVEDAIKFATDSKEPELKELSEDIYA